MLLQLPIAPIDLAKLIAATVTDKQRHAMAHDPVVY